LAAPDRLIFIIRKVQVHDHAEVVKHAFEKIDEHLASFLASAVNCRSNG